mgnify:CR=1 FL=1
MDIKKYYEKLAKNMRVERAKRKISQLNLATKAGISLDTVNMIERGVANPTLFTIISIAKALDVDLNTLIPIK